MTKLSPAALHVLGSMQVEGHIAAITTGQLDRKLYTEVNKVLEGLGGKWNRVLKAHVFDGDPEDALDQVMLDGTFTDKKKAFGFFCTPLRLADKLAEKADIRDGMRVLEPSAGHGHLAKSVDRLGVKVDITLVEIQPENAKRLDAMGYGTGSSRVVIADFMSYFPRPSDPFDRVVMNPPFQRQQDIDHVLRAFSFLKPGGKLAAIMSAGVLFRENRKTTDFLARMRADEIVRLPEGSFAESGTNVSTVMLIATKR